MAKKKKLTKRNPVAKAPILGKGGAHGKSRKAKRLADKRKLKDEVAD
jgi:hypothetical protein